MTHGPNVGHRYGALPQRVQSAPYSLTFGVTVAVGLFVGVGVGVLVGLRVGVAVGVFVGFRVGVGVGV